MFVFNFVILLCASIVASDDTYRAGVIDTSNGLLDATKYVPLINEAAKLNVDVLVLPSPTSATGFETSCPDDYDEIIKTLSTAAKQAGLYVVAHLHEKTRCHNKNELIRSNLVFDQEGAIISVYRKPLNNIANCTAPASQPATFKADFGVTFGVLMEEDLVTQNLEKMKDIKNLLITGKWSSEIPFLSASQFSSSYAYIINANLVTTAGIFAGKTGSTAEVINRLVVADLKKSGGIASPATPPVVTLDKFPSEDLSQYVIRPIDLMASVKGYKQNVCHGTFCCEFYVKTSYIGSETSEVNYGLAAFDGIRHFGRGRHVGAQNCAVFACAGLYKRTCTMSENNSTNVVFEKLTISGNFTKDSIQYPIIQTSTGKLSSENFNFDINSQQVTVNVFDSQNLLKLGIFGRNYANDFETEFPSKVTNTEGLTLDIYEYIYNEDVQEFFDYVWIRLRILMFVVSIYILEMM